MRMREQVNWDAREQLFAEVTQISTTPETLYNYASFLKTANRGKRRASGRRSSWRRSAHCRGICRDANGRGSVKARALLKELANA